jgi:hypothetical protein
LTSNKIKRGAKRYQPDLAVTLLMIKLLQSKDAEEERQIMKSASKDQQQEYGLNELEEKARKHKRYLDKEKVAVLDKYVFQAMANITFFFKCVADYPTIREVFEDDIKDLLGVRREKPQEQDYGFIFFKLLYSVLLIGQGVYDKTRIADKDFRLRLNQILQEIVWSKVDASLTNVFKNASAQRVVSDDFHKTWAWTCMLADSVDQAAEDKVPPRRTIEVRTDHLKEDIAIP